MVKRIEYIDYLKAFAIFTVVVGHAIQQLFGTDVSSDDILYRFIYSFHMPLFFFLSGFCAFKYGEENKICLKKEIVRKAMALLIPYIVWGIVRAILQGESFLSAVLFKVHGGLWFLLCLFEIFVCFYVTNRISFLFNRNGTLWRDILIYGIVTIFLILLYKFVLYGTTFSLVLDFDMLARHFKYFILGYLLHKYSILEKLLTSSISFAVFFLLFWIAFYLEYNPYYSIINFITLTTCAVSAIIVIYTYFKSLNIFQWLRPICLHIGRYTLDIYIIHMFFFFGLKSLRDEVAIFSGNLIVVLILSVFLSVINIIICVLFSNIIVKNKFLSFILLGKRIK